MGARQRRLVDEKRGARAERDALAERMPAGGRGHGRGREFVKHADPVLLRAIRNACDHRACTRRGQSCQLTREEQQALTAWLAPRIEALAARMTEAALEGRGAA